MYPDVQAREFRNDINGLRAWAVLAVILYHFNVPGFNGGFVGVDVFFVISGFLMAGIIIPNVISGCFSFSDFYFRRALKIIPPLFFVVVLVLSYGWLYLSATEYELMGKQALAAISFVSNFIFSNEIGYFEALSNEKWLLHTWSLSVEWQFYLIFPVIIFAVFKLGGKKCFVPFLVLLFLSSLVTSYLYSEKEPLYAFYLLPARAWELLSGVGVWFLVQHKNLSKISATFVEVLGFILIGYSIYKFDSKYAWPSYNALVPVVGTCFIIWANIKDSVFTNSYLFRRLGESSYSIYLVHWPIMILFVLHIKYDNQYTTFLAILLSLILGWVLYFVLEINIRRMSRIFSRYVITSAIAYSVMSLIIFSGACLYTGGFDGGVRAFSKEVIYVEKYSKERYVTTDLHHEYRSECNFFDDKKEFIAKSSIDDRCFDVKGKNKTLMLWGDSHAQALSFGIRHHLRDDTGFIQVASSGCSPDIGAAPGLSGEFIIACKRSNTLAWNIIKTSKPDVVVMAQRWLHEKNDYIGLSEKLKNLGVKKIVIIGPVPQWKLTLPKIIALRHFDKNEISFSDKALDNDVLATDRIMKKLTFNDPDVTYISVIDTLCQKEQCLAKIDYDNTPLSWDYGHLTLEGSNYIVSNVIMAKSKLGEYLH
ncbi:acyltransferase family protein [Aeromonas hydrophila]|uniref:acyltransferase family protein n=1 Tax=Aeromonas hydrophila TaxID=644 RepID=UPI00236292B0|nr:acyltransferase family protein [Aeromonas hydrophila]